MNHDDNIIRAMAKATAISWCTRAPYSLGEVGVCRVGFASMPSVTTTVHTPASIEDMVPVARQHVYRSIEATLTKLRGFDRATPSDWLALSPIVGVESRRRFFIDENEDSPTLGKRKRGSVLQFTFEIIDTTKLDALREMPRSYRGAKL